jgi:hypothetical protein
MPESDRFVNRRTGERVASPEDCHGDPAEWGVLPACPWCGHPGYYSAVLGRRYCGNAVCEHTDALPDA